METGNFWQQLDFSVKSFRPVQFDLFWNSTEQKPDNDDDDVNSDA